MKKWTGFAALLGAALCVAIQGTIATAAEQSADDPVPTEAITSALKGMGHTPFPIGKPNSGYAKYFTGNSYLQLLAGGAGINVANVTFAPGTINFWHKHHKSCQVLVGVSGAGWYQIWGEEPQKMEPGTTVTIPEGVKHWHGAAKGGWFQHLSIMLDGAGTEWLEPVSTTDYDKLNGEAK